MRSPNQQLPEKDFRKKLDTFSESFCAAKWYNSTIWLGAGQSTSCHHPPSHMISKKAFKNPSLLHNTKEKKKDRKLMLKGKRPKGCDYCWRVQDTNTDAIPDRVFKSHIYTDEELKAAFNTPVRKNIPLKTLEISFDRTCNFACSYCNPGFSTTWVKDIKEEGPYKNLKTDDRHHFTSTQPQAQLYDSANNPYIESFWNWWDEELKYSLLELRITGGEPSMSPELWKLFDKLKDSEFKKELHPDFILAINSNLGMKPSLFEKLKMSLKNFSKVDIYTSCEAMGKQAEYIRDGLDFKLWNDRIIELISSNDLKMVNVMCTVNALCLPSLPDFLNHLMSLRVEHGFYKNLTFTLNILRFPAFQSCLMLPTSLRKEYQASLRAFLDQVSDEVIFPHESAHVERLIGYLDQPQDSNVESLQKDFKTFFSQYDKRRNKNFAQTFPKNVVNFYETIKA